MYENMFLSRLNKVDLGGLQFNNVDLALQLLDNSSLGKDVDSFRRTKAMLARALKGSVDRKYTLYSDFF
jgi:hypothetical protein